MFVDTKISSLSETGEVYDIRVRNRKILATTCLTNESVLQETKKSRLFGLRQK